MCVEALQHQNPEEKSKINRDSMNQWGHGKGLPAATFAP
jgi:hypothetical protein